MKYIFWPVLFVGALVLQWWWSTYLSIGGLAPQCLLVLTVAVAAYRGPEMGQGMGFFWGLFLDTLGVHLFGAHALLLSLMGFLVGRLRRQVDVASLPPQVLAVWVLSIIYSLLYHLLGLMFLREFLWWGWWAFVFVPIMNACLAPFVFYLIDWTERATG
ncbi:MAG: rod shape-determining protein MreD [Elusimicrobia bacterium]|nr:rod shape-determining protein MreD [Elusimicrobiota bacterium]